jgi:hypothetical protein
MGIYVIVQLGLVALEAAACIAGFLNWRKIRHSYWKWFPLYLLVLVPMELTCLYLVNVMDNWQLNSDIYMYFGIPFQFLFFYWLMWQYLKPYRENKWPLYGAAIYLAILIADLTWLTGQRFWFSSLSYTVGNIVLLVLILLFFIKFIKSEEILRYRSSIMFWVCLGLLVFYLGTFPFFALRSTLYYEYRDIFNVYLYVTMGLDYLMYIFFTLAFVWTKPN